MFNFFKYKKLKEEEKNINKYVNKAAKYEINKKLLNEDLYVNYNIRIKNFMYNISKNPVIIGLEKEKKIYNKKNKDKESINSKSNNLISILKTKVSEEENRRNYKLNKISKNAKNSSIYYKNELTKIKEEKLKKEKENLLKRKNNQNQVNTNKQKLLANLLGNYSNFIINEDLNQQNNTNRLTNVKKNNNLKKYINIKQSLFSKTNNNLNNSYNLKNTENNTYNSINCKLFYNIPGYHSINFNNNSNYENNFNVNTYYNTKKTYFNALKEVSCSQLDYYDNYKNHNNNNNNNNNVCNNYPKNLNKQIYSYSKSKHKDKIPQYTQNKEIENLMSEIKCISTDINKTNPMLMDFNNKYNLHNLEVYDSSKRYNKNLSKNSKSNLDKAYQDTLNKADKKYENKKYLTQNLKYIREMFEGPKGNYYNILFKSTKLKDANFIKNNISKCLLNKNKKSIVDNNIKSNDSDNEILIKNNENMIKIEGKFYKHDDIKLISKKLLKKCRVIY